MSRNDDLADGYEEDFEDSEPEDYFDERYERDDDIPVRTETKDPYALEEDPEASEPISIEDILAKFPASPDVATEDWDWSNTPEEEAAILAEKEAARKAEESVLTAKVKAIMLEFWNKFYPEEIVSDEIFEKFIQTHSGFGYLLEYKRNILNVCNAVDSLRRFISEQTPTPEASQPPPGEPPQAVLDEKATDVPVQETVQDFECANDWADAQVMKFLKERDMEKFTYNRIAQELKIDHNQARHACVRLEKMPDIIAVRLKNPKNTKSTKNAKAGFSVYYKYAVGGKAIRDMAGINKLGRLAQLLFDGISRDTGVGYKELLTKVRTYLICVDSTLFSDALKFLMELGVIDSNFGKHGKRQFVAIRNPDITSVINLMRSDKWIKYPHVKN